MEVKNRNDIFRRGMIQDNRHRIVLTQGVAYCENKERIVELVRDFDSFTGGNDPYEEHDFGMIEVNGQKYFFKIEYYDLNYEWGVDPHETSEYALLMTIMRADEY